MATMIFSGFEAGDLSEVMSSSGTVSVQNTTARNGGYALRVNPTTTGTGFVTFGLITSTNGAQDVCTNGNSYIRFYFSYATKPSSNDEQVCIITHSSVGDTNNILEIRLDANGNLRAYDGAGSLVATGSTDLSSNTWYRLEAKALLSGGVCTWELKIDGSSEISGSFANSQTVVWRVVLGKAADKNGNSVDFFYDDFFHSSSSYPGDGQCVALPANAAGSYQTWTRGGSDSGNNWDQVNELPSNGDTDYLLSNSVSNDSETEGLVSATTAGISGVINSFMGRCVVKRHSVSSGSVRIRVRSNSTNSDGSSNYSTTSSYTSVARLLDADPDTGSAWTTSGIDAVEVGLIERSASLKTRVTSIYGLVDYTLSVGAGTPVFFHHLREQGMA